MRDHWRNRVCIPSPFCHSLRNLIGVTDDGDTLHHSVTARITHGRVVLAGEGLLDFPRFTTESNRLEVTQVLWRLAVPRDRRPRVRNGFSAVVRHYREHHEIEIQSRS